MHHTVHRDKHISSLHQHKQNLLLFMLKNKKKTYAYRLNCSPQRVSIA